MKLKDNFFKVGGKEVQDDIVQYTVSFEPKHFIYKAHFPDNPVTPGVCIIQMVQELAGEHLQYPLRLRQVVKAKFQNVINPLEYPTVNVSFSITPEEQAHKVTATVFCGETKFSQLTVILQPTE